MHVPGRQILHRALALVLMLDSCRLIRSWWQSRLESAARLDAGLFVGTEHVLVSPEWLALPATGVQVEHWSSHLQEVWVTRKDPAVVAPRSQRVLHQPAPDAAARRTHLGTQDRGSFRSEFTHAIAAERYASVGRSFARQGDHQGARRRRQ